MNLEYWITLKKNNPLEHVDTMAIGGAIFSPSNHANHERAVQSTSQQLQRLRREGKLGGNLLCIAQEITSLPAAIALSHEVAHLYGAIAVYDAKVGKYVICITHHSDYKLGDWIKTETETEMGTETEIEMQ
jgi:CRISPR-associated protein Csx3